MTLLHIFIITAAVLIGVCLFILTVFLLSWARKLRRELKELKYQITKVKRDTATLRQASEAKGTVAGGGSWIDDHAIYVPPAKPEKP